MNIERTCIVITAMATVILAGLGVSSLVASSRAWVGPVDATFEVNRESRAVITVAYRNSGKEPASDFGDTWDDDWIGNVADGKLFSEADLEKICVSDSTKENCARRIVRWQQACQSQALFQHRVAFPDFKYDRKKIGPWVDGLDQNKVVFLQGCFVYRSPITTFLEHRTAFCYYYRVGQEGDKMRACPMGSSAD